MIADRQTTRGIDARGRESRIDSEEFAPDDARMAAFQALPERLYRARLPEPVSSGARCLLATRGGDAVARLSVERDTKALPADFAPHVSNGTDSLDA